MFNFTLHKSVIIIGLENSTAINGQSLDQRQFTIMSIYWRAFYLSFFCCFVFVVLCFNISSYLHNLLHFNVEFYSTFLSAFMTFFHFHLICKIPLHFILCSLNVIIHYVLTFDFLFFSLFFSLCCFSILVSLFVDYVINCNIFLLCWIFWLGSQHLY